MPRSSPVPRGPLFFPPGTPRPHRCRRIAFVLLVLLATLALLWPLYPLFAAEPFPLILGLPRSLVWVVGWLGVVFAALIWLYRAEARTETPAP